MRNIVFLGVALLLTQALSAQTGADTIHYKKVYYFAGTGLGIPLGSTKDVLSPKLFAGSMGVDFTLKNPKYYVYPALYLLSFDYDQQIEDSRYNTIIENGSANFYMLSLAGGTRRQFDRLNTYIYAGPTVGMVSEPRAQNLGAMTKIESSRSLALGTKVGVGADYKFKSFFIGGELGYMYNFHKIQGKPFQAMTFLVGLKSDITKIKDKVAEMLGATNED